MPATASDVSESQAARLAAYCRATLPLQRHEAHTPQYHSLAFCVLDMVWSPHTSFGATRAVIGRYAEWANLPDPYQITWAEKPFAVPQTTHPLSQFVTQIEKQGTEAFAVHVLQNRQRTPPKNGILKAEAALRVARALCQHALQTPQDVCDAASQTAPAFEADVRQIPGQNNGAALRTLYRLCGATARVGTGRFLLQFITDALNGPTPTEADAQTLLHDAATLLRADVPTLTPAALDTLIWWQMRQSPPRQSAASKETVNPVKKQPARTRTANPPLPVTPAVFVPVDDAEVSLDFAEVQEGIPSFLPGLGKVIAPPQEAPGMPQQPAPSQLQNQAKPKTRKAAKAEATDAATNENPPQTTTSPKTDMATPPGPTAPARYDVRIREMPADERPRERLIAHGPDVLSVTELLAILLRTGTKQKSAVGVAQELLSEHGGLRGVGSMSVEQMANVHGIGTGKAAQIKAAIEFGRRLVAASPEERAKITSPRDVFNLLGPFFRDEKREHFIALLLDTKNGVINRRTISIGDLSSSIVHPREVFLEAIRHSAASLIVAHNHPSGDPAPSPEDVSVTRRLKEAGELLGIEVLDHIVLGDSRYVSLKEKGLI